MRILSVCGPHTFKQFVERCTIYLRCVSDEAKLRETQGVLDLQSYTAARRENSAIRTCFSLFSVALDMDYPDAMFEDPIYERLYFAAADMVCWSNVRSSSTRIAAHILLTNIPTGSLLL